MSRRTDEFLYFFIDLNIFSRIYSKVDTMLIEYTFPSFNFHDDTLKKIL